MTLPADVPTAAASLTIDRQDFLRAAGEFALMRESGRKIVGRRFVLVHVPAPDGRTRAGFIVSRKYHKHAVQRNRARRLLRESFRHLRQQVQTPVWVLLIARAQLQDCGQADVQRELRDQLGRAGYRLEAATP